VSLGLIASFLVLFLIVGFADARVAARVDDPAFAVVFEVFSG
jgi:type IV secretory pathway TrbD component